MMRVSTRFALVVAALCVPSSAHAWGLRDCKAEIVELLRPAFVEEVLLEYRGRADASLQLEHALNNLKMRIDEAVTDKKDPCEAVELLKKAPAEEVKKVASLEVKMQKLKQDMT